MAKRGGRDVSVWRHAQALMLLQLLGAACALAAGPRPRSRPGGFRLPVGGEDGFYHGELVGDTGEIQVKYLGKGNATSPGPNVNPRGIRGPGRKLLREEGVVCQDSGLDPTDSILATMKLSDYFGFVGNSFSKVVFFRSKSVIACGCDYGNGQQTTSIQMTYDADAITETCCGWGVAGWYSHDSWKSSYGRCSDTESFC